MSRRTDPEPWRTMLFDKQLEVYDYAGQTAAILGTRRGGKSTVFASRLLKAVTRNPRLPCGYVTMTKGTSMNVLWGVIAEYNKRWDLGLTPNITEGKFYTRQGGYIWLAGCKDKREADKFRGYKYSEFIIDEGGTHRDSVLTYLIKDALAAALTDNAAPLWLGGTPGPVPQGYYWAVTTGLDKSVKPWKTFGWSVLDNPHHAFYGNPEAVRKFREDILGVTEDDPSWIREFLGQWCLDNAVLVYYVDPTKNRFDGIVPRYPMQRRNILGIDLGYDDETAFCVTSSYMGVPNVWVQYSYGESAMPNSAIAAKIKKLVNEYDIDEVYIDAGGLGKSIMHTLNVDYGLSISPAEKHDKVAVIRRARQGLTNGNILIGPDAEPLVDEANVLLWNDKMTGHKDGMPDHNCDAFLYSYRPHFHWDTYTPDEATLEERAEEEFDRWALT